jgi:CHAT domain-containing protein/lipopolysaccharide biosynthesis regulator YciM
MTKSLHVSLSWLMAGFWFAAPCLAQRDFQNSDASKASPDETAARLVVKEFFTEYGKKNLAAMLSLWRRNTPELTQHKQSLRRQFSSEDVRFDNLAILLLSKDTTAVMFRVTADMVSVDLKTTVSRMERLERTIRLVREDEKWRIFQYRSPVDEFADHLLSLATDADRTEELGRRPEHVTSQLIQALINQGVQLFDQGRPVPAEFAFGLAKTIAERLGDKSGLGDAFTHAAFLSYMQGRYEVARDQCRTALALLSATENPLGVARALYHLGSIDWRQSRYSEAWDHLKQSLVLSEGLGEQTLTAQTLNVMGIVRAQQSDYVGAIEQYQASLVISEGEGHTLGVARALANMGLVYFDQGDYTRSLEVYHKALAAFGVLNNNRALAATLFNIGTVHSEQGYYSQAIEFFERSRTISETLGDKRGISDAFNNLGTAYREQGNYIDALEHYQKSAVIKEALGHKDGIANVLLNIGNLNSDQGDYRQAAEYYRKALALFDAVGDKRGTGMALGNLGNAHRSQGLLQAALEYYQNSVTTLEAVGAKANIANVLDNIGALYREHGEYSMALQFHHKSLAMQEATGNKNGVARTLVNIARVHELQGRTSEALESAELAADLASQIGRLEVLWRAQVIVGNARRALGLVTGAARALESAIAAIETLRTHVVGSENAQQLFFETKVAPYHAMVELLLEQDKAVDAFAVAEHAKSRVVVDVLAKGRSDVRKAMTIGEQKREEALRAEIVTLNTQISRETARKSPDAALLAQLNTQLQKTRLEFEGFKNTLYAAHPELRIYRGDVPTLKPDQVHGLLLGTKTALVEFVVTEQKTFLFVVTNPPRFGIEVYSVVIKEKDLTDHIERFRRLLASADGRFPTAARQLYDLLLLPVSRQLKDKGRLVIVPDGPLWELPFQALQAPGGRYVIEDHTVSFVPSLTVLREMIRSRSRRAPKPEGPTLLAMGNPALGKETVARVNAVFMDEKLEPLPDAERQVRSLAKIYGSDRVKSYVGGEAREERFKSEAGNYGILHLATHGILNDRSPMYSHLLLAQTGEESKEDGLLEAWELMNLDLKADLAVLSACETARGRVGKGEGMIGLTWALFVSGVPTTVVSQWKVRSDSTADLMVEFHRRLRSQSAKSPATWGVATALREAALKVKADPRYRHPFHWAGFIVIGDGH